MQEDMLNNDEVVSSFAYKIQEDLKQSMISRDETKVSTLRMLISELNNFRISKGEDLSESDIISVVQKEVKKRREASLAFKNGGRDESSKQEEKEAAILEGYLPAQMSDEELSEIITQVISETGAVGMSDMGKVMGLLKEKVGASADPSKMSQIVRGKLNG